MAKRSGANRLSKIDCLKQKTSDANTYINDHSKAKTETQIKNISALISKFKLNKCIAIKETSNQQLDLVVDQNVLKEMEKLDGCYVLKTDLDSKLKVEVSYMNNPSIVGVEFRLNHEIYSIDILDWNEITQKIREWTVLREVNRQLLQDPQIEIGRAHV